MYELDRIIWDFCDQMGFRFDFSAPSHREAMETLKKRLKQYQEKQWKK